MKRFSIVFLCIIALAVFSVWAPNSANAYSDYSGCQGCHGGFRSSPYTSRVDGMSWGDDMHDVHRNTMLNRDCGACHMDGSEQTPVLLNQSQSSNGRSISCVGCHDGAGLREHHRNSGAHTCSGCHSTNETPAGEDVQRPYYEGLSIDPCNPDGSEDFAGSNIGLDNDGDLDYDTGDPDCPECTTNEDCDDGDVCNGAEVCGNDGTCQPGTPLVCDDENVCNGTETCHPIFGCQDGTPLTCDNGQFCDGAETCDPVNGCQSGTPPSCNDGVACTDDSCDEGTDACVNAPNDGNCDNGLFCDGAETCDQVAGCQNAAAPCDPATQTCNEETNICEDIVNGCASDAECNDGNACNGMETCDTNTGNCMPGSPPVCDDGNVCNGRETCDPATGCQAGTPLVCDDGQFCNGVETCDPVAGCLDGQNPCASGDTCDEASDQCVAPECRINADCDDGMFCNGIETCVAGLCQPGTDPCAAGETCEEAIDQCVAPPVILDIAGFRVTKRVSLRRVKPVKIKLVVKNPSQLSSSERDATVIGMQNGVEVYAESMNVAVISSGGRVTILFPSFTPSESGNILWTATVLDDARAANATATATTKVVP